MKLVSLGNLGLSYVEKILSKGNHVARGVAEILSEGRVYTYLPDQVDATKISLEHGGISNSLTGSIRAMFYRSVLNAIWSEGYTAIAETFWEEAANTDRFLPLYPESNYRTIVLDLSSIPVQGSGDKLFSSIYGILTPAEATLERLEWIIEDAGFIPFGRIVLCPENATKEVFTSTKATASQLMDLGRSSDHVILNAYDGESYVLWTKTTRPYLCLSDVEHLAGKPIKSGGSF